MILVSTLLILTIFCRLLYLLYTVRTKSNLDTGFVVSNICCLDGRHKLSLLVYCLKYDNFMSLKLIKCLENEDCGLVQDNSGVQQTKFAYADTAIYCHLSNNSD